MRRKSFSMFLALGLVIFSLSAFGQGFNITKPSAIGGSFVATHSKNVKWAAAGPGLDLFLRYDLSPSFFLSAGTGIRTIYDDVLTYSTSRSTLFPTIDFKVGYNLIKNSSFSPYFCAGLTGFGRRDWNSTTATTSKTFYDVGIIVGGGIQLAFSKSMAFHLGASYRHLVSSTVPNFKYLLVAQTGLTYTFPSKKSRQGPKEEIEYPIGEGELSLDDLFRDDNTTTDTSSEEEDALALLFQPDNEEASIGTRESSSTDLPVADDYNYTNTEVQGLLNRIETMKSDMAAREMQIMDLQAQVLANEKAIAQVSRGMAGEYVGLADGYSNSKTFKTNYEMGLKAFYNKKFQDSIQIFRQLMTTDPDHQLASNCQYWIGEAYNAMKDYRNAIDSFNVVLKYRKSYKLDDALIMNGLCYFKLGDKTNARDNFQELLSRFPDSEYAPKAMRYLGQL